MNKRMDHVIFMVVSSNFDTIAHVNITISNQGSSCRNISFSTGGTYQSDGGPIWAVWTSPIEDWYGRYILVC